MNNSAGTQYPWHESAWNKIVSAKENDHLPHALLISGAEGTGKKGFSENLAQFLLCTSVQNNKACGSCPSCKTYLSGANPDFMRINLLEDKQQISVDQIRNLSQFINYTRSYDAHRVILLNPTERMNLNAANSLLKSLEEPASNTIIILVATSLSGILPTIKSRCQLLSLPTPEKALAITWLSSQHIDNTEELLEIAQGCPLKALDITDETLQSRVELANDLVEFCTHQTAITEIAKKWEKYDPTILLNWQISWIEQYIKAVSCSDYVTSDLSKKPQPNNNTISKLYDLVNPKEHWGLYQNLIRQKQYVHTSVNSLLYIENMLLLWLQASKR